MRCTYMYKSAGVCAWLGAATRTSGRVCPDVSMLTSSMGTGVMCMGTVYVGMYVRRNGHVNFQPTCLNVCVHVRVSTCVCEYLLAYVS